MHPYKLHHLGYTQALRARTRSFPIKCPALVRPGFVTPISVRQGILLNRTGLYLSCTSLKGRGQSDGSGSVTRRWYSTEKKDKDCVHPTCPSNKPATEGSPTSSSTSSESVIADEGNNKTSSSSSIPTSQPYQPTTHHIHPDYPPFITRLLSRLPHPQSIPLSSSHPNPDPSNPGPHPNPHSNPHPHFRPTKDQLLSAATSFWQRLRIRWKWFSIRSWRRFNMDDWTAFGSWVLVGNTIWIIIGTTTFVSVLLTTLNSLSLQTQVTRLLSDYLTRNTGFNVVFEEGMIKPRWKEGRLRMGGVFVSRRPVDPASEDDGDLDDDDAALGEEREDEHERWRRRNNYTMFDLNVEEVEVTLSLARWFDGKGLVKDAKVRGVRGVIDRRHVFWDTTKPLVPADFRHPSKTGDFELDNLEIEDFLVTVHQPSNQRPFNVSIFNAQIGPFRKRWMFYDLMSAVGITGQYDNCLFSLHKPQKLGKSSTEEKDERIKRLARFRIDGLPIEHAQYATGFQGPMSWITSGKLDAVLDVQFPRHPDEDVDLSAILNHLGKNVADLAKEAGVIGDTEEPVDIQPIEQDDRLDVRTSAEAVQNAAIAATSLAKRNPQEEAEIIPGQHRLARPALRAPGTEPSTGIWDWAANLQKDMQESLQEREVKIDIDLRFRDIKAAVPLYTTDLSVSNNAFIRPIVAFMNANKTLIPIHCSVKAPLSNFDGSWTLFETGLTSTISRQIHAALTHHVSSSQANKERIRTVGAWGVQRGAEAVLNMVRTVVDPLHGQAVAAT